MKGACLLIKELERQGVDYIFGYPGGAIMPVYDALFDSRIEHILTRQDRRFSSGRPRGERHSSTYGSSFLLTSGYACRWSSNRSKIASTSPSRGVSVSWCKNTPKSSAAQFSGPISRRSFSPYYREEGLST